MNKESVKRIEHFEPILDKSKESVDSFKKSLEKFNNQCKNAKELSDYYGSEEWFSDFDAYENGEIDKNIKCGVLSEDEVFDVIEEYRSIALEMLDTASYILKNI